MQKVEEKVEFTKYFLDIQLEALLSRLGNIPMCVIDSC